MDPARPNKAQYIAAVPPADVEMTDADKAGSAGSLWPKRCNVFYWTADKDGDWMAVGWVGW